MLYIFVWLYTERKHVDFKKTNVMLLALICTISTLYAVVHSLIPTSWGRTVCPCHQRNRWELWC